LGLTEDVFLSIPCVVGHEGVQLKVTQTLNSAEKEKLMKSVNSLAKIQGEIQF